MVKVIRRINHRCVNCERCIHHCPVGAIEKTQHPDSPKNQVNLEKCKKSVYCFAEAFCMYKAFSVLNVNVIDNLDVQEKDRSDDAG